MTLFALISLAHAGSLTLTDAADFAAGSFENTDASSVPGDVVLSRVLSDSGQWIDGGTGTAMMLQKDDATWFDTGECPYYPAGVLTDNMTVSGLPFRAGPYAVNGVIAGIQSGVAIDPPSGANYVDAAHILHPGGRCTDQTHTFTWTYTDGSSASVSYNNTWDCQSADAVGTDYAVTSQGAVGTGPCCEVWYEAEFINPNPDQLVDSVSMTYNDGCGGAYLGQIWAVTLEMDADDYSAIAAGSTAGSFTSAVVDSGTASTRWDNLAWSANLSGSDTITLAYRSGATSSPDSSWSAWSGELSQSGALSGVSGQYIQVRATFSATDAATALQDITLSWAVDADGDGSFDDQDCDDAELRATPGGAEVCDGVDNDCNGVIDGADASDASWWYADGDQDGYGRDNTQQRDCAQPSGFVAEAGDCNDNDALFHPNAEESDCTNPNDYNCDGSTGYADADADGYAACADCDDNNPAAQPGGVEVCDGADNDCSGTVDGPDAVDALTFYADADGDGYGDDAVIVRDCRQPDGVATAGGDCDDQAPDTHPGALDIPGDGVDQDCQGGDAVVETDDSPVSDDSPVADDSPSADDTGGAGKDKSCGCASGGSASGAGLLGLALLIGRRRREAALRR